MRQLFVSPHATVDVSYSSGLLANGAIDIQKKDSNGEITSLVPGDLISNAAEIRFVQGTAAENIVSPWIAGRNVMVWDGKSYNAPVASTGSVTATTTSASAGELEIKFIRKDRQPQEFFTFMYSVPNSQAQNDQATGIHDAFEALTNIPDWLNPLATASTNSVTFVGAKNGDVAQSGAIWDEGSAVFDVIITESSAVADSTYTDASDVIDAIQGTGDGYDVKKLEDSLMGSTYGYYNRLKLPNTPANKTDVAATYNMYTVVATKDGSTSPQIKGVDNLMEIYIALDNTDATDIADFEDKINPYLNSAGFSAINL
tara:strand:- start:60 stop:1001 length:942 start_codon:yes stop_codon:yes gene_type:complete